MLKRLENDTPAPPDPTSALLHHLRTGNDVLRTAAVRALAEQSRGEATAREALLAALLDEDPDVRADAMEAFAHFATPRDVPALRRSLEGDPVREVKLAAISLLARLQATDAVDLLRDLVSSRCDGKIAWEDEGDAWDDWLDVQIAAIDALGHLGAVEALGDMLAARDDEFGQTLDRPVFAALARFGSEGANRLLAIARAETGLARIRALDALAGMNRRELAPHLDHLLADGMADVRALALPLLGAADNRAEALVRQDPDPGLRRAALLRFAGEKPGLAIEALADDDDAVQATALDLLTAPIDPDLQETLADNLLAWLRTAGPALASAAARRLAQLAPNHAGVPLATLASDTERPLEARIAAVNALAGLSGPDVTERLISLLSNASQQIRTIALTHLADRAQRGEPRAEAALAAAIEGSLLPAEAATIIHPKEADSDLVAPKTDDAARPTVRISADGEIIEDRDHEPEATAWSTLDAIQLQPLEAAASREAETTPEEAAPKRRRRRPVEGPEAVADDLARVAMRISAEVPSERVEAALMTRITSPDEDLRAAAWTAISDRDRLRTPPETTLFAAESALSDPVPVVRAAAARVVLSASSSARDVLAPCLADEDALVRSVAVRAFGSASGEEVLPCLSDPAQVVRNATLEIALRDGEHEIPAKIVETLLDAERIDTLGRAITRSGTAYDAACAHLAQKNLTAKQALVLLEAFALPPDQTVSVV